MVATDLELIRKVETLLAGRVRALAEAGAPALLILEVVRGALDLELGPIFEVVHESSGEIAGEQLCLRCGVLLPHPHDEGWVDGELVVECYRWGAPLTFDGHRALCAYLPASGPTPRWCAWPLGPAGG